MSTWTSSALVLFALSACVAPGGGEGTRLVRLVATDGASFAIAAPPGFCLTGRAAEGEGGTGFAAFARCPGARGPAALLTATAGAPGSGAGGLPEPAALADFFRSEAGLRSLSREGRATTVSLHEVLAVEGAVLLRLTDRSRGPGPALEGQSWRAVTVVGGRLVTLSATGAAGAPLEPPEGRRVIDAWLAALRAANRAPGFTGG